MQIQPQLSGMLLQILYFVTITQLFVEPKTLPLSFFRAHSEYAFREQLRYQLKEVRRKFSTFASFGLSPKGFPDSQYFWEFFIAILNHRRKEYVGIFRNGSSSRTNPSEWIIRRGQPSKTESQNCSVTGHGYQGQKGDTKSFDLQRTKKSEEFSLSVCWCMIWIWLTRMNQMI